MVMIVNAADIEAIIVDMDLDGETGLICETNSRNRRVRMELNENHHIEVFNGDSMECRTPFVVDAVETFNHFGSRPIVRN